MWNPGNFCFAPQCGLHSADSTIVPPAKFGSWQENVTCRHQSLAAGLREGKHIFLQRSHSHEEEEFSTLMFWFSLTSAGALTLFHYWSTATKKQTNLFDLLMRISSSDNDDLAPLYNPWLSWAEQDIGGEYMRADAAQRAVMHNIDLVFVPPPHLGWEALSWRKWGADSCDNMSLGYSWGKVGKAHRAQFHKLELENSERGRDSTKDWHNKAVNMEEQRYWLFLCSWHFSTIAQCAVCWIEIPPGC